MTLTLPVATTFDVVSLQEAVDHRSQRIESFVIETWDGASWTAPPTVDEQATVGHKRLLRLTVPVTTQGMRVRITSSRLEPALAEMGLFLQALPPAPAVTERGRDGRITLSHPHPEPIVYTVDGTPPTAGSPVYKGPVSLPDGGTRPSNEARVVTARHPLEARQSDNATDRLDRPHGAGGHRVRRLLAVVSCSRRPTLDAGTASQPMPWCQAGITRDRR